MATRYRDSQEMAEAELAKIGGSVFTKLTPDYEVRYLFSECSTKGTMTCGHVRAPSTLARYWLVSLYVGDVKVAYAYLPAHLTREQAQAQGAALAELENVRRSAL